MFLLIRKLEWFGSKQILVDGMYLFVNKDLIGLYVLTETSQHYFILCTGEILTVRMLADNGPITL